jgi:hypothetical protein
MLVSCFTSIEPAFLVSHLSRGDDSPNASASVRQDNQQVAPGFCATEHFVQALTASSNMSKRRIAGLFRFVKRDAVRRLDLVQELVVDFERFDAMHV